ncbi:uracil-DNA glycosylase [Paracoccus sp. JM45]|nr:uracil-DNA glycosylase [Paracoccus sp. JM45]
MLHQAHIEPLSRLVDTLRNENRGQVPDFDPLDGGVKAQMLFIMEKPGPMTDPDKDGPSGSGFISRDNNDPTAEALFCFMREAEIDRRQTVLWNAIPWWNNDIQVYSQEWKDGLSCIDMLLDILPCLQVVVLVGKKAEKARKSLEARGLKVFISAHPSPQTRGLHPELWRAIPDIWREAATELARLSEDDARYGRAIASRSVFPTQRQFELRDVQLSAQVANCSPSGTDVSDHRLDLVISLDPFEFQISHDETNYTQFERSLINDLEAIARACRYASQDHLICAIAYVCACYRAIQTAEISITSNPAWNGTGSMTSKISLDSAALEHLREN